MKAIIIIPLYNEEKTIQKVIKDIKSLNIKTDILVVNDKSNDNSLEQIESYKNIKIINNSQNIGYEKSLEKGIQQAYKLKYKFIITLDADGEHNTSDIPNILDLLSKENSMVTTNRSQKNRISEYILGLFFNLLFSIRDPLSGFKGYNLEILNKNNIQLKFNGVGTYILVKVIQSNLKISSINTKTCVREDNSRYGSGFLIELKLIISVLKQFFTK